MTTTHGEPRRRQHLDSIAAEAQRNVSDQQLLERFTAHRDQAAFARLVERYSRPVWGVCQRVLHQVQDAEDAFQATFLVFARKATSIRKGQALGSWLYGVAYRTSLKARQTMVRRKKYEQNAPCPAPEQPAWGDAACRELQRLLDDEVQNLPSKYREPFVLCCLEGLSRSEAAQELEWKEGTLSARLAQARELLRKRLAQRGVALSAVLTATALAQSSTAAAAPAVLVHATLQGIAVPLAGQATAATLSPSAVSLSQSVFHGMMVAKIKMGIAVVVAAATVITGGTLAAFREEPRAEVAQPAPPPAMVSAGETFVAPPIPLENVIDERVLTLAYSPDGKKLVVAGARGQKPGQLGIWDVETARNLYTFKGVVGVRSVAWSPTGETIASGDFAGMIRLWDGRTGEAKAQVNAHRIGVNGVAFSSDGKSLVSAGLDKTVKLWELLVPKETHHALKAKPDDNAGFKFIGPEAAKCVKYEDAGLRITLPPGTPGDRPPTGLSTNLRLQGDFSITVAYEILKAPAPEDDGDKNGTRFSLAVDLDKPQRNTASNSRKVGVKDEARAWVTLWNQDLGKNQERSAVLPAVEKTGRLRLVRQGTALSFWVSEGANDTFQLVQRFVFGTEDVKNVRLIAITDGPKASLDMRFADLRILSGSRLREQKVFLGHTEMVFAAAFFHHGQAFVTCGQDKTARIWDVATGKETFILNGHKMGVESVAVSPDDKLVATACWDGTIKLWDAATGMEAATLAEPKSKGFFSVAFSSDGKLVAGAGGDGCAYLWDVKTNQPVGSLEKHADTIWALAFSPTTNQLATGSADKTAKVWDPETKKATATLETSELKPVRALAYAPDGKMVAIAMNDRIVRLRAPKTGAIMGNFLLHKDVVNCLAFSPNGRLLATGSSDRSILIRELATAKKITLSNNHTASVRTLAFSPDGQKLASAGDDKIIHLWDTSTGKELAAFQGHESSIFTLAFAPDGRHLASGGEDRTIKVWDVTKESDFVPLQGHDGAVRALAYAVDGTLASASDDGTVKLWTPGEKKERLTLNGHTKAVLALAFSPSGRTLVSGGADSIVILWDPTSGQMRDAHHGHLSAVTALAIHPQAEELLSGGDDTNVLRWSNPFVKVAIPPPSRALPPMDREPIPVIKAERTNRSDPVKSAPTPAEQADKPEEKDGDMTWLILALSGGIAAMLGIAAWLYFQQRRPVRKTPPAPRVRSEAITTAAAAPIVVHCSGCGKNLKVKAEHAGKRAKCPKCGEAILVKRS